MKRSGLRNRFSQETRSIWELDWHECMVCGLNQWNVLHHIISPSSRYYIDGKHNESAYNSCPIHNYKHPSADILKQRGYSGQGVDLDCHIGNDAYLHSHIPELLKKTAYALDRMWYASDENDREFLKVYAHLYK